MMHLYSKKYDMIVRILVIDVEVCFFVIIQIAPLAFDLTSYDYDELSCWGCEMGNKDIEIHTNQPVTANISAFYVLHQFELVIQDSSSVPYLILAG